MANDRVVAIRITADGKVAIEELDKVNRKLGDQPGTLDKLKQSWVGVTVAVTAAAVALKQAWDLADKTAAYYEQVAALDSLGKQYGQTGEQIVAAVKESSRGLVSLAEAADMSAKALNLGLNPQQVLEFTRVSEQLTDVIGGTIPQAFERMTVAAASGRTMTLAQMGIMVDLEGAYKKYAEANGTTVDSLSETTKHQIRLNAILDQAKQKMEVLGPPTDTVKDKMDRLRMQIEDLKISIGGFVVKAGLALYGLFQGAAAAALALYAGLMKIGQASEWLKSKFTFGEVSKMHAAAAQSFKDDAAAAWAAAEDLAKKGNENLAVIFKSNAEVMAASGAAGVEALRNSKNEEIGILEESAAKAGAIAQKVGTDEAALNRLRLSAAQSTAGNMAQAFQMMYAQGGESARKWFTLYKLAAISEAVISTYAGAARALKDYPAPWSYAVAASVIAAGLAKVASIRAQQFGSSAAPGGAGGGGYPTNPATGLPENEPAQPAAPPVVNNYHIYGTVVGDLNEAGRVLAPAIRLAEADGVH